MRAARGSIRVRTYLRTGSGARLVEDRILRPITPAERKSGVKDEYGAYIATYGEPGAGRRRPRRVAYINDEGCGSDVSLNMKLSQEGTPSKEDQAMIHKMMRPHLALVARDLARGGIISYSDLHDMEMALFVVCRDSLADWDPNRAGLRTYLYRCVGSATANFVAEQKCQKRAHSYRHLAIVNAPAESEEDDETAKAAFSDAISVEAIPDRMAIAKMEFAWAYDDLVALLDADERLALDYLLRDYDQSDIADWMDCTLMTFRRHILRSLQAKAMFCGFEPCNGTLV